MFDFAFHFRLSCSPTNLDLFCEEKCSKGSALTFEEAEDLFYRMLAADPKPSVSSFNTPLSSIVRMAGHHLPAVSFLFNSLNRSSGVSTNSHTFFVVIDCCCRLRCANLGSCVFGMMLKRGHAMHTSIFNSLLKPFCLERRLVDAVKVLDRMPKLGVRCRPDVYGYCCAGMTQTHGMIGRSSGLIVSVRGTIGQSSGPSSHDSI